MKFRQNLAVKILSVMAAISVLASCGSAPSKVSSKNNSSLPRTATGDDPQKFGAMKKCLYSVLSQTDYLHCISQQCYSY